MQLYMESNTLLKIDIKLLAIKWMPPSLRGLTPMIFNKELAQLRL